MTLQQIRAALRDQNLSAVARDIGMSRQQLWQIVNGVTSNPSAATVQRISEYLESGEDEE